MLQAQLYFLSDQYYQDFPDDKLMQNKDIMNGTLHSRPCFFAFKDYKIADIYWIVPISSRFSLMFSKSTVDSNSNSNKKLLFPNHPKQKNWIPLFTVTTCLL